MKAIIFNHTGSAISSYDEAFALRAAYLISEQAIATGVAPNLIYFTDLFHDNLSTKMQLHFMELFCNHYGWSDFFPVIENFKNIFQSANKLKHPPPQVIAAKKKVEYLLRKEYLDLRKHIIKCEAQQGLTPLRPLMKEGEFSFINTEISEPEKKTENKTAVSEIMQTGFDREGLKEGLCLMLTDDFFTSETGRQLTIVPSATTEAMQPTSSYGQTLFALPDLNLLTAAELLSIRQAIQPQAASFQKAVRQWVSSFEEGKEQSQISTFNNELIPAASTLAEALSANPLLRQQTEPVAEVLAVSLPITVVWQQYRECKTIPDESWQKMQEMKEEIAQKMQPVFIIRYKDREAFRQRHLNEEQTLRSVKKSIAID